MNTPPQLGPQTLVSLLPSCQIQTGQKSKSENKEGEKSMKIVAAILKMRRIWVAQSSPRAVRPRSPLQIEQQIRPSPLEKARKTIGSRLSSCQAAVTFTVTDFHQNHHPPARAPTPSPAPGNVCSPFSYSFLHIFCYMCGPKQMLPETDFHPPGKTHSEHPFRLFSFALFRIIGSGLNRAGVTVSEV